MLVLACLAVILQYPTSHQSIPCLALIVAFCLIAGGADMFGLFSMPVSHRLGELAYGIYLIHGIVLFTVVNFVVGVDATAAMSTTSYWALIALMVPVTLAFSGIAYHYIEKPGIKLGKQLRSRSNHLMVTAKV